jgi:RNA ligase
MNNTWDLTWERCPDCPTPLIPDQQHRCIILQDVNMTYPKFPSIPRFNKPVIVTEKIDGTNGQVRIWHGDEDIPDDAPAHQVGELYYIAPGSRNRWLTPEQDNFGFAAWVYSNAQALVDTLGDGQHFGEWWGPGIQRGYGLAERRFSLFNTSRWHNEDGMLTECVPGLDVVPVLGKYDGQWVSSAVEMSMHELETKGSVASPGFMRPEGVVVYHTAANQPFKVTFDNPEGKWRA